MVPTTKSVRARLLNKLPAFPILSLLVFVLGSCNSDLEQFDYSLRIYNSTLPTAFHEEFYRVQIKVADGLRPFSFELGKGSLPQGIILKSGWLIGTPTMLGTYSFTVVVSDAKLSKTFQDFEITVTKPPPPEITLNVPSTDIHENVTIRAHIKQARLLQSLRTWVIWDPKRFDLVEGSLSPHDSIYELLFETQPGILRVDLAVLGTSLSGDHHLFNFVLRPRQPGPLQVSHATEYLSELDNHSFTLKTEGHVTHDKTPVFPKDFFPPAEANNIVGD